jgi:hypothetical protein
LVPKLVLRHALSGNIHLVQFGSYRENFVLDFYGISPFEFVSKKQKISSIMIKNTFL